MPYIFQFIGTELAYTTLTFPLGGSIPLVAVPYATLSVEILFYIMYPLLLVPTIRSSILRKDVIKLSLFIILISISYFIFYLLSPIQLISYLQPHLIYHCIVGVALGYLYRNYMSVFKKLAGFLSGKVYWLPIILLIAIIFMYHILIYQYNSYSVWIAITISIPFRIHNGSRFRVWNSCVENIQF